MLMTYVDIDALYRYYKQLITSHNKAVEKDDAFLAHYMSAKISTVNVVAKMFGLTHELERRARKDKLHVKMKRKNGQHVKSLYSKAREELMKREQRKFDIPNGEVFEEFIKSVDRFIEEAERRAQSK